LLIDHLMPEVSGAQIKGGQRTAENSNVVFNIETGKGELGKSQRDIRGKIGSDTSQKGIADGKEKKKVNHGGT